MSVDDGHPGGTPDLRQLGRLLAGAPAADHGLPGSTSDLSIDEILLLHSVGLEPVHVVAGAGVSSIAAGQWTWGTGAVTGAERAFTASFDAAKRSLRSQLHRWGAVGVVGTEVELRLFRHHYEVVLTGTSVRPLSGAPGRVPGGQPFLSDLSARDIAVLSQTGWWPRDLVHGVSFVHAPRRSVGAALGQATQNVELANFTETLYAAREAAMAQVQQRISEAGGTGLVDAKVRDHPVHFAGHVVEFVVWGTAVALVEAAHRHPELTVTASLDDPVLRFEARSMAEGSR